MTEYDFEKFKEGLAGIYGFYEKEINPFVIDIWWNALKSHDIRAINQAFGRHVVNPDNGKWIPRPSDIIRMLQGSVQDNALRAWVKVDRTVRCKGVYVDIVFDDPLIHKVIHDMGGWIGLGMKTEDEWPFVAKDFENRYRGYRERSEIPENYPGVLTGIANMYNTQHGFPSELPVMIGDIAACERVMKAEKEWTALWTAKLRII